MVFGIVFNMKPYLQFTQFLLFFLFASLKFENILRRRSEFNLTESLSSVPKQHINNINNNIIGMTSGQSQ